MAYIQHSHQDILRQEIHAIADRFVNAAMESQGDIARIETAANRAIASMRPAVMSCGMSLAAETYRDQRDFFCPTCNAQLKCWIGTDRNVVTAEGDAHYRSARYHCNKCHHDHYPFEEANDISGGQFTTGAKMLIAQTAASQPYAQVSTTLLDERGVSVSPKEVDRKVREVAGWCKTSETDVTDARYGPAALKARLDNPDVDPLTQVPPSRTFEGWKEQTHALISVDGGHVRSPKKGPKGLEWFECKIGIIAPGSRDLAGQTIYLGGHESADDLFSALSATWLKGGNAERDCAFVADGAQWIWNRVPFYFPKAVPVLDIYHASEHVASAARECWGEHSEMHRDWTANSLAMLLKPQGAQTTIRAILSVLRLRRRARKKNGIDKEDEKLVTELRYLLNHRHRMKYHEWESKGRPISSGAMESAVKQIAAARLRQPGMKWTHDGAHAMIHLRSAHLSNALEGIVERRHDALRDNAEQTYSKQYNKAA